MYSHELAELDLSKGEGLGGVSGWCKCRVTNRQNLTSAKVKG